MEWLSKTSLVLSGALGAVMVGIFKDEVVAWLPRATTRLIDLAARRMPLEHQEQSREEWLAHVAEYAGNVAPLYQAICILIGSGKSKIWTVSRAFKYALSFVFMFQIYNLYHLIVRNIGEYNSGSFAEHLYVKSFFAILSFAIIIFCLRMNVRDLRAYVAREALEDPADQLTLKEAAIVTRWAVAQALKKKLRL